jgi:hypothetical protein
LKDRAEIQHRDILLEDFAPKTQKILRGLSMLDLKQVKGALPRFTVTINKP